MPTSLFGVKAAFFDLDDTLCDDSAAWMACARIAAALAADDHPGIDVERLAQTFLGISERYWMSLEPTAETRGIFEVRSEQWFEALEAAGYSPSRALSDRLAGEYGRRRSTEIALFPDVVPTLTALRQAGVCLALITNGLQMTHVEKIAHLGLEALFDHVVIADAFGCFKPDPRIFAHALELCGCDAEEAVMIGDDLLNDIGGAEALGIRSFWYNPAGTAPDLDAPKAAGGELKQISDVLDRLSL